MIIKSKVMSIPWTPLTKKVEAYFTKIKEAEVPSKVDGAWLKAAGWRSGDDYKIIVIWKTLGLVDAQNQPTNEWLKFKTPTSSRKTLARAIKNGYSGLFSMYSDAWRKDDEALYSYFMSKTGESEKKVTQMVTIFKTLVQMADFQVESPIDLDDKTDEVPQRKTQTKVSKRIGPSIHINIELHLPATDDIKVYDNLFMSMKKHLLTDEI